MEDQLYDKTDSSNLIRVDAITEAKSVIIQHLLYSTLSDEEIEGTSRLFDDLVKKYSV